MSAFAAWDFFNASNNTFQDLKDKKKLEYLYRTFEDSGKIDFTDFVGSDKKEDFAKKIGLFTALSYLALLDKYDFFEQAQRGDLKKVKIEGFEDIDAEEIKNLKTYMSLFHFGLKNGKIIDGWLRQVHRSAGGGDKFLLNSEVFSSTKEEELTKFNFNTKLFQKDSDFENRKFKAGLLTDGNASDIFDKFLKTFIDSKGSESISNKNEVLIKRTYDTLCQLYNFKI